MFHLTAEGWRKLTLRWSVFFLVLAVLNEIIWRTQTTDLWVAFKVFGVVPLTFVFAALQYPLLMKHDANPKKGRAPRKLTQLGQPGPFQRVTTALPAALAVGDW